MVIDSHSHAAEDRPRAPQSDTARSAPTGVPARSSHRRIVALAGAFALALSGAAIGAPAAGALGIRGFFAANCNRTHSECGLRAIDPSEERAESELFTQAGGYVPFGITDFAVTTTELEPHVYAPVEYPMEA